MGKFFDRELLTGFLLTLILFGLLNIADYVAAYEQHVENLNHPMRVVDSKFPSWGFPFHWRGYNLGELEDGLVLNSVVFIGSGIVVGFLFRFLTAKFKDRKRV